MTASDIDRAIRQRALLRGAPPAQLAPEEVRYDPQFLFTVAQSVLQDRELLRLGARLDLLPDLAELVDAWRAHPELAEYYEEPLDRVETRLAQLLDLALDDIYHLLRTEIVAERWLELVLDRTTEEQLRNEYFLRHQTATVRAIQIPNLPTSEEMEAFIAAPPSPRWFEAYHTDHASRFRQPASLDLRIVGVAVSSSAPVGEREAARQRAEALRREVEQGADMVAMSRERSEHPAAQNEDPYRGLLAGVVQRQLPAAFELADGEISPVEPHPTGFVFYRVQARHRPALRPLDHTLRREIAAQFLSHQAPLPRPAALANDVLEAVASGDEPRLDALVAENLLIVDELGPMPRSEEGMIPGLGRAPELLDAIFDLDATQPYLPRPYLVEGRLWVVSLISRVDPTEADFETDREAFERQFETLIRTTAWDAYWMQHTAENRIQFDLPPEYFDPDKRP